MTGNNVSHAMNKTKRKFSVNLVKKRFFVADVDAHRIETWHAKREHAVAQQNELFHAVPDKNWGVVDTQRVGFNMGEWEETYDA